MSLPQGSSQPAGWVDGAPTSGIGQSCAFCGTRDVAWVHPLDPGRVAYLTHGKVHTLPTFWSLCDPCEQVYRTGDDDAAVARMRSSTPWGPTWVADEDVAAGVRTPLTAFRDADLGARRLAPDSPALVAARAAGLTPLDDLTGAAATLGPLWPTCHRRWLDERAPGEEPGLWMVRSPWPSLSLTDAIGVLWTWVERDPCPEEDDAWAARVVQALGWTEAEAVAFAREAR